jgi:hypothetical protein
MWILNFEHSETVEASAAETWRVMRDFAAIERAGIAERVEMMGDGVGSSRHLQMAGGAAVVERLETRDDDGLTLTYVMTNRGPMPLERYQASLQITGNEQDCKVTFTAEYEPDGIAEENANRMLGNVYRALISTARTDLGVL